MKVEAVFETGHLSNLSLPLSESAISAITSEDLEQVFRPVVVKPTCQWSATVTKTKFALLGRLCLLVPPVGAKNEGEAPSIRSFASSLNAPLTRVISGMNNNGYEQ